MWRISFLILFTIARKRKIVNKEFNVTLIKNFMLLDYTIPNNSYLLFINLDRTGQFPSRYNPEGKKSGKFINVILLRQVNFKSLEAPQSEKV